MFSQPHKVQKASLHQDHLPMGPSKKLAHQYPAIPLCLFLTLTTASISWIMEDLVPVLCDIPLTCIVDVSIYITSKKGDLLQADQTMSQAEPTSPDIEKHLQTKSQSLSIKMLVLTEKKWEIKWLSMKTTSLLNSPSKTWCYP